MIAVTTTASQEQPRRIPQDPDRLFKLRVKAGLTQRQLGEQAGLSDGTICRIETGRVAASVASLQRLAVALGCEIADLMPEAS